MKNILFAMAVSLMLTACYENLDLKFTSISIEKHAEKTIVDGIIRTEELDQELIGRILKHAYKEYNSEKRTFVFLYLSEQHRQENIHCAAMYEKRNGQIGSCINTEMLKAVNEEKKEQFGISYQDRVSVYRKIRRLQDSIFKIHETQNIDFRTVKRDSIYQAEKRNLCKKYKITNDQYLSIFSEAKKKGWTIN